MHRNTYDNGLSHIPAAIANFFFYNHYKSTKYTTKKVIDTKRQYKQQQHVPLSRWQNI